MGPGRLPWRGLWEWGMRTRRVEPEGWVVLDLKQPIASTVLLGVTWDPSPFQRDPATMQTPCADL